MLAHLLLYAEQIQKDVYMKLVKIFSVLGLVLVATACGSSQPTTAFVGSNTSSVYPQNGNYGNGQALYNSAGQLIGYKSSTPIIYGSAQVQPSLDSSYFPMQVNAGDRISYNLIGSYYKIGSTTAFINTTFHEIHSIPDGSVTFNGSPITSGTVVPTAGTVAISLSPLSAANTITSYLVYIPYGVSKDYCTNTSGAVMACP